MKDTNYTIQTSKDNYVTYTTSKNKRMNKVIIDGCNVAECEHLWRDNSVIDLHFCRINFDNNYFSNGIPCCDKCNKHPNCYYKQLKRLEKDFENLREAMHKDFCSHYVLGECSQEHHENCVGKKQCIHDLEQIISNLKAENEKLKAEVEDLNFYIDSYKQVWEVDKYRKALEEIRGIAKKGINSTDPYERMYGAVPFCKPILDKIGEVLK